MTLDHRLKKPHEFGEEPEPRSTYDRFVAHCVEAAVERDPSSLRYVANHVLVSVMSVGENGMVNLTTNGEPYVERRVYPSEVLKGAGGEYITSPAGSIREVAVNTLAHHMAMYCIEHDIDALFDD